MPTICKNVCIEYKEKRKRRAYENGFKFCKTCDEFIKWGGIYCPCCGCRLRTLPQDKKFRVPFKQQWIREQTIRVMSKHG